MGNSHRRPYDLRSDLGCGCPVVRRLSATSGIRRLEMTLQPAAVGPCISLLLGEERHLVHKYLGSSVRKFLQKADMMSCS